MDNKYQRLDNGTCYYKETNQEIIDILEQVRVNRSRIRIYLGKNGKSWDEENDITGYVGRSTGENKIPLLIQKQSSFGGGAILTYYIVKIVRISDKKILYQHKNFAQGFFTNIGNKVYRNKEIYAPQCKNENGAKRLCDFMNGKRFCK